MNTNSKIIRLSEYDEIPLNDLESKIHTRGIRLLAKLNKIHKVELFKFFYDRVKATQYVGFVKIRDFTIQVIPKIFRDSSIDNLHFLLQLLKYTRKISIKERDLGNLGKLKDDFFEVIIFLFAKNLRDLLRLDFKKSYVNFERNIPFLKGKLLLKEHIKSNLVNNTKYFCGYQEFTENNLMNQVFKYTASLLMRMSHSALNKKLLEDILIYLCDVGYVNITPYDLDKIHFTRLNRQYEPLVNLCKLILQNMSVQFSFSKLETFVFMFDMNRLFEEFVFEFVKRNRSKIFVNGDYPLVYVKDQIFLGKLFDEFAMKGDVLLQDISGRKVLLDTKYKVLDNDLLHGGLSQADFYQMFAYSTSQEEKYKDIILLYPSTEVNELGLRKRVLAHNLKEEKPIQIYIKTIKLTKIFDTEKKRINEIEMIKELNQVFVLSHSITPTLH